MLRKVLEYTSVIVLTVILFVTAPVNHQSANASIRHECNCRNVQVEVWEPVEEGPTIWGKLKKRKPRIKYTRKCDVKWHLNPFYHTGACD